MAVAHVNTGVSWLGLAKEGRIILHSEAELFLQTAGAMLFCHNHRCGAKWCHPFGPPSHPIHAVMYQLAGGEQSYHSVMESEQKCISSSHHSPCKSTEMGLISREYACVPQ